MVAEDHLAWFVLGSVAELDLVAFYAAYRSDGWGANRPTDHAGALFLHHVLGLDYLARRQAEGKTKQEALRALKRHLARRVFRILTLIAKRINNPDQIDLSTAPRVPCLT